MKTARKMAMTLVAAALSVGVIGVVSPAHALDTNWPCAGCRSSGR